MNPPCLLYEDEHLLVVNKPAGLNTHLPSPFAGEGLYDWLRNREPRWAHLAIIHRLDKETSGVIVFSKSSPASRSLTQQFTERSVRKQYLLLTNRPVSEKTLLVRTALVRVGDHYQSRPLAAGSELAETRFSPVQCPEREHRELGTLVEAEPLTGRTHQIRVHAADRGFPILGDTRYGGSPAPRVCLHAARISFKHPISGQDMAFTAAVDFSADPRLALRNALIEPQATTAFRLVHGASDGWPGVYVDRVGDYLLIQSTGMLSRGQMAELCRLTKGRSPRSVYQQNFASSHRRSTTAVNPPKLLHGPDAPGRFNILENGLTFELSFTEGQSIGLFFDQRDNRRRLLTGQVAAGLPLVEP